MTALSRRLWWGFLVLVVGGGIAWGVGNGVFDFVRQGWDLLLSGDPERVRDWLLEYGIWAPIASALLQILASLIPFLPGFLLSIPNAMLYGVLWGGLLTFSTVLLAAAVCFWIARVVGRPGLERIVSPATLGRVNNFVERRGWWAVFWGRLLPFINHDVVSYAAGLTRIGWIPFLLATGAGALPSTIFYSFVGAMAMESVRGVVIMVIGATFLPLVLFWFLRKRLRSSAGADGSEEKSGRLEDDTRSGESEEG